MRRICLISLMPLFGLLLSACASTGDKPAAPPDMSSAPAWTGLILKDSELPAGLPAFVDLADGDHARISIVRRDQVIGGMTKQHEAILLHQWGFDLIVHQLPAASGLFYPWPKRTAFHCWEAERQADDLTPCTSGFSRRALFPGSNTMMPDANYRWLHAPMGVAVGNNVYGTNIAEPREAPTYRIDEDRLNRVVREAWTLELAAEMEAHR